MAETRQASSLHQLCGYSARFQNIHYGCHGRIDFGVGVVEVRGETDSGVGTPIYEDVAGQKLAAYLLGIRHVDGNRAAALLGVAGRVDTPSVPVGKLDQPGGLAFRFLADFLDTDFLDNLEAGTGGFYRRNVSSPVHEAKRGIGVAYGTGGKGKRIFVGEPAGDLWL